MLWEDHFKPSHLMLMLHQPIRFHLSELLHSSKGLKSCLLSILQLNNLGRIENYGYISYNPVYNLFSTALYATTKSLFRNYGGSEMPRRVLQNSSYLNAKSTTRTITRVEDVSSTSGMCPLCIRECLFLCEISLSAFRGREALYLSLIHISEPTRPY